MKLTDEMCDAIAECARRWNWERMGETSARARIREDLQQAFNALPDPEEVRAEIMEGLAYGRSVERQALDARIAELEEKLAGEAMLPSLQAWWERHALALRATSRSVHHAIGVAISALEKGQPFPTMQVLTGADKEQP